jgi:PEP-CTERM motif
MGKYRMSRCHVNLALAAIAATAIGMSTAARADAINATLSATYFEVAAGTDPDFGTGGSPVVAIGSALGADGFPVATGGVNDIDATTGELTWWSPALNSNVSQTGTGTVSLPYSSNMFAPNSTGTNDSALFETAILKGQFTLSSASTIGFVLGSDDDSFIYIDGVLVGQNPGIHGVTTVDFTDSLSAGAHTVEVFYDDRQTSGASLSLTLDGSSSGVVVTPPTSAPEPASLALLATGLVSGATLRRRRRKG